MNKVQRIEAQILQLDSSTYQRLCEAYLYRRGFRNLHQIGLVAGRAQPRPGTPDTLVPDEDGKFALVEYSTQKKQIEAKLSSDLDKCLDEGLTGIPLASIREVVLCHTAPLNADAIHRMSERCRSRGVAPRFVSIGELTLALYNEYPDLARDFLGVAIDTGQVMSPEAFIAATDNTALSTPLNTEFRFRESQLIAGLDALSERDLVLVVGRPGVGKTRYALEVCRRYVDAHPGVKVRCIRSRGRDLFDDLMAYCQAPGSYLLLIDDANRVPGFEYVLDLLASSGADRKVKVIATVRDYAVSSATEVARRYCVPAVIELPPLSDEEIRALVTDVVGATVPDVLDRITDLACGNPRLALMAAQMAVSGQSVVGLRGVGDLYDQYFAGIRLDLKASLDTELLRGAAIVAFLRQVDRTSMRQLQEIEATLGLEPAALWAVVERLHELEAVDVYEDEIVRISDQVLATYLFYLATVRERVVPLRVLLTNFFPRLRERFADALTPLFTVYGPSHLLPAVEKEVRAARQFFQERGDENALIHLLDLFWFVLPTEALEYVRDAVEALPSAPVGGDDTGQPPRSRLSPDAVSIIRRFSQAPPELLRPAVQLLARLAARAPTERERLTEVLCDDYAIGFGSLQTEFAREHLVLDTLWDEFSRDGGPGVMGLLLRFSARLLETHVEETRGTRRGLTIRQFQVPPSEPYRVLRQRAWEIIAHALTTPEYRALALDCLHKHADSGYKVGNAAVVADDALVVVPMLRQQVDLNNYGEVLVALRYLQHMRRVGLSVDAADAAYFDTPTARTAHLLIDDWLAMRAAGPDAYRSARRGNISDMAKQITHEELRAFLGHVETVQAATTDGHDTWQLQTNLQALLAALADCQPTLFLDQLFEVLHSGNRIGIQPHGLVGALCRLLGAEATFERLSADDIPDRGRWLMAYFAEVPAAAVTAELALDLVKAFQATASRDLPSELGFVERYEQRAPGTYEQIVMELCERAERDDDKRAGTVLAISLVGAERGRVSSEALLERNPGLLKRMYMIGVRAERIVDLDASVFDDLVSADPRFVNEWVDQMAVEGNGRLREDDHRDYSCLWWRDDYEAVIKAFVEAAYEADKGHLAVEPYANVLFRHTSEVANVDELASREDGFLDGLITEKRDEPDFLEYLFNIIAYLPQERRRGRFATLLRMHPDVELFKQLAHEPAIRVIRGSWVPDLQRQIDYLESLLPLCDSVELLPHRTLIVNRIESLRIQMEEEKRRDFLQES